MKRFTSCFLFLIILQIPYNVNCLDNNDKAFFINGMDISYLEAIEKSGGVFRHKSETDFFKIIKKAGINTVRIRLWNDNEEGESSLSTMLSLFKRAKKYDMKLLLDFHYSDTWADPGNQTKPLEWQDLSLEQISDAVRKYSKETIETCIRKGVYPDYVQIGNEISSGFLWDTGRITKDKDSWLNFTTLLKSAIAGVKEADSKNQIKTIIHHHAGSDAGSLYYFYKNIQKFDVDYDIIGVSYYPFYSKDTINTFINAISKTNKVFNKPVLLVETAYPWTYQWHDHTHNVFGKGGFTLPEFPVTKKGQKDYMDFLVKQLKSVNASGVIYWGGEWIPTEKHGSMWENLAFFDFAGNALPALFYVK